MKNNLVRYIIWLLLLFLGWGCSDEHVLTNQLPEEEVYTLKLTFRAGDATENGSVAENNIVSIRLIAYEYISSAQPLGVQIKNVYYVASDIAVGNDVYQATIDIPKGKAIQILAIANEMPAWNLGNANMTVTELYEKNIDYRGNGQSQLDIKPPFPMLGKSVVVNSTDIVIPEIRLVRTVAKVSLRLKCTYGEVQNLNGDQIVINSVSIMKLPRDPFLGEGILFYNASEGALESTVMKTFRPTYLQNPGTGENTGFITQPGDELVFYIPEHIISDVHNYTYIQINGERIKGGASVSISYNIVVGEEVGKYYEKGETFWAADMTKEELSIIRNTHYMFDATILTVGTLNSMEVFVRIENWIDGGVVDGNIPQGPYLNVSNLTVSVGPASNRLIYFWSNQPEELIYVEESGILPSGEKFKVNDLLSTEILFTGSDMPVTGTLSIKLPGGFSGENGTYKIYLNAGGLKREVKVIVNSGI